MQPASPPGTEKRSVTLVRGGNEPPIVATGASFASFTLDGLPAVGAPSTIFARVRAHLRIGSDRAPDVSSQSRNRVLLWPSPAQLRRQVPVPSWTQRARDHRPRGAGARRAGD